jgi:hypothetical protein
MPTIHREIKETEKYDTGRFIAVIFVLNAAIPIFLNVNFIFKPKIALL